MPFKLKKLKRRQKEAVKSANGSDSSTESSQHSYTQQDTSGEVDGSKNASSMTTRSQKSVFGEKRSIDVYSTTSERQLSFEGLHYFYGSSTALQIYAVVIAAILLGRLLVLHGVTLLLLRVMFNTASSYYSYFARSNEYRRALSLIKWVIRFGIGTAAGALEGSNLRRWMAGSAIHIWQKGFFFSIWRFLSHEANERILAELRRHVAEGEKSRLSQIFHV